MLGFDVPPIINVVRRTALGILGMVTLLFVGDEAAARFRRARDAKFFGSVHISPMLAVPQKNGRIEWIRGDEEDRACTPSLFPHFGYAPCWYLRRQTHPRIDM